MTMIAGRLRFPRGDREAADRVGAPTAFDGGAHGGRTLNGPNLARGADGLRAHRPHAPTGSGLRPASTMTCTHSVLPTAAIPSRLRITGFSGSVSASR